ncbi:MAG: small basic protein [Phycisphaerales bacterium]|nr:small basic protein [Phycisphaerales bacterium]
MSIHASLKSKSGALNQHRNVLTRTERIAKLMEIERFSSSANSALGLPKVRSIKAAVAKKPKKADAAATVTDAVAGAAKPDASKSAGAKPGAGKGAAGAGKK